MMMSGGAPTPRTSSIAPRRSPRPCRRRPGWPSVRRWGVAATAARLPLPRLASARLLPAGAHPGLGAAVAGERRPRVVRPDDLLQRAGGAQRGCGRRSPSPEPMCRSVRPAADRRQQARRALDTRAGLRRPGRHARALPSHGRPGRRLRAPPGRDPGRGGRRDRLRVGHAPHGPAAEAELQQGRVRASEGRQAAGRAASRPGRRCAPGTHEAVPAGRDHLAVEGRRRSSGDQAAHLHRAARQARLAYVAQRGGVETGAGRGRCHPHD